MNLIWVAKYRDNSYIVQNGELPFERISRHNLWQVIITAQNNKKLLTLEMKPGYVVFYRRRAIMSPGSGTIEVVHLLGYKVPNTDISVVSFIYETDWHIEVCDFKYPGERISNQKEYKHAIELLPEEQVQIIWD